MQDYKPNSHRFKEEQKKAAAEEKKIEKVVKGKVKTKKRSEISKLSDVFISEDGKEYIITAVTVAAPYENAVEEELTIEVDLKDVSETSSAVYRTPFSGGFCPAQLAGNKLVLPAHKGMSIIRLTK